jgi:hypothetical protein
MVVSARINLSNMAGSQSAVSTDITAQSVDMGRIWETNATQHMVPQTITHPLHRQSGALVYKNLAGGKQALYKRSTFAARTDAIRKARTTQQATPSSNKYDKHVLASRIGNDLANPTQWNKFVQAKSLLRGPDPVRVPSQFTSLRPEQNAPTKTIFNRP